MKLKAFFEQNTWASVLVLVLVVVAVGVVMYYRIKNAQEELERRNPAINVYGNKFGKKKGRMAAMLLFIGFIIVGWLIALPYIL